MDGIIIVITVGNIVRFQKYNCMLRIMISCFIILVFPLSLLWFINHVILQIPAFWFVKLRKNMLIQDVTRTETISHWIRKEMILNSYGIPPLLVWTIIPNIAFIIIVVIIVHDINYGYSDVDLYFMIASLWIYLGYYVVYLCVLNKKQYLICTPFYAIFITIKSILMWILIIMKIFNIAGFGIFGLKEKNWDTIYNDICGCSCNECEIEYNKYIKYLKWYIKERRNILSIYINDNNVINIIIDYLNSMENRHNMGYSLTHLNRKDEYLPDKDIVIDIFSLNGNYIEAWMNIL